MMHHQAHLILTNQQIDAILGLGIIILGITALISFIAHIFFCRSLFISLGVVPENQRRFPRWFIWMTLIPIVGMVFAWMMLPFGIPTSFQTAFKDDHSITDQARSLFGIGLTMVILMLFVIVPYFNIPCILAYFVLMIIYWVKAIDIGRSARSQLTQQGARGKPRGIPNQ